MPSGRRRSRWSSRARGARPAVLGALAGLGMTLGALVSLAISRAGTIFDYSEPTLRDAVVVAAIVELAVVLTLAAFLLARRREGSATVRTDWTASA